MWSGTLPLNRHRLPAQTTLSVLLVGSAIMRTNIERAINGLILSNKDITLPNALPVCIQEAGFEKMSPDALVAFEHASDKCPKRHDESRAVLVKGISTITKEYWSSKPAMLDNICRTYCDRCACRLFNLKDEAKARGCEHREEEEKEKVSKRRCKSLCTTVLMGDHDLLVRSRKKGRRDRTKRDVVAARSDPYAPSTSTVRL